MAPLWCAAPGTSPDGPGGPAADVPLGGIEEPNVENPQNQNQVQVELGEREAEGIYSNVVFIAHSASEVILDFARALPGLPKAKVYARVILTPQHAKSLLLALEQNLGKYEASFGVIKLPGDPRQARELGFRPSGE
jgi:hypothetical protein